MIHLVIFLNNFICNFFWTSDLCWVRPLMRASLEEGPHKVGALDNPCFGNDLNLRPYVTLCIHSSFFLGGGEGTSCFVKTISFWYLLVASNSRKDVYPMWENHVSSMHELSIEISLLLLIELIVGQISRILMLLWNDQATVHYVGKAPHDHTWVC
jgi:hypothetical protein